MSFISTGEIADSGALRREFFEDILQEANDRLLEGENDRRVIKKDWELEFMYEVMGVMVAHSIIQEGPGLPCFSLCLYHYFVNKDCNDCYPEKADIPLNICTHQLITLIEEVIIN